MENTKKTVPEHAVSPVVGVMLMLVVTIIIAAVVSAFAGGMGSGTQKAPNAVLDVKIHELENQGAMPGYGTGYYVPTITINQVSGDYLPTEDLKITTVWTNKSGVTFGGNLTGENWVHGEAAWNSFTASDYSGVLVLGDQNRFGYSYIYDNHVGYPAWFGNRSAVLRPGDVLTTAAQYCGNYNDNTGVGSPHNNPGMNWLLGFDVLEQRTAGGFGQGSIVKVTIGDKKSGKLIFDKEVKVQ